jgi:hypothetical protein
MSKLNAILNDLVKLRNNAADLLNDERTDVDDRVSLARLVLRLDEAKEAFAEGRDFEDDPGGEIPTVTLRIFEPRPQRMLTAIKLLREHTGLALKPAKDALDAASVEFPFMLILSRSDFERQVAEFADAFIYEQV